MRWLCLSDVHGDADALAAVLATAERREYSKVLAAGDLVFPGDQPLETWRRLTQAKAVCAQGLGDRAVAIINPAEINGRDDHERSRLAKLRKVQTDLGDLILSQLSKLPAKIRLPIPFTSGPLAGGEILLVHGSPVDPTEPFSHEMSDSELRALIGDDPADIILCGGSHVPFDRTVMETRIINLGSVGEAIGAPNHRHADATFVEFTGGRVVVEQFAVPLDKAA
jgi:predicted phosphodiesterase